jgi:1,4-alpha-glucan branching enzyme/maltooligosyltrehalose trehalohydrolase
MPFGAQLTESGAVRFRLWAPQAHTVELVLEGVSAPQRQAMRALAGGWFELESNAAHPGTLYRYAIDGAQEVPDPASRFNPHGVHGPSEVIDAAAYPWDDGAWRAPSWHTAVIYEVHVGTFDAPGDYAAIVARLPQLVRLGVTAIELMPLAAFPGARGWGYDGVLLYAPQASYGRPDDLKALIAAAHGHGLAVILDVVYNHFGPEGNYLHLYAKSFFNESKHTPWGAAINFDGEASRSVRDFFIHNALYWLEEYHLDGLRLDAVHAMHDGGEPHFAREIAHSVRTGTGRSVYVTLENFDNTAQFLGIPGASWTSDAQWNDDVHHCLHVILTGETHSYYADYGEQPHALLARALAQGFAFQGEHSRHAGGPRGQPSGALPPTAFINFLQNHDQVGNRALGERITRLTAEPLALRAASSILLLAPSPPMIFMGEEWAADEPFPWFCDFEPQLAQAVTKARESEFPGAPPPAELSTFQAATLDWGARRQSAHARVLTHYRRLLTVRRRDIMPLIPLMTGGSYRHRPGSKTLAVDWEAGKQVLHLLANLGHEPAELPTRAAGRVVFATHPGVRSIIAKNEMPPWSVLWLLERKSDES